MKFKQFMVLTGAALASGIALANWNEVTAGSVPKFETMSPYNFSRGLFRRTPARWQWFEDTYWYVPASSLRAYVFDVETNEMVEITDQTVFNITAYRGGYFWGKTVVDLEEPFGLSCMSLVGSVTPEGDVSLTFTPIDPTPTTAPTEGIGTMRFERRFGGWTMENQMSTGPTEVQVSHWAYMVQSYPGERSWESLPGRDMSIPDFLDQCPGEGPQL